MRETRFPGNANPVLFSSTSICSHGKEGKLVAAGGWWKELPERIEEKEREKIEGVFLARGLIPVYGEIQKGSCKGKEIFLFSLFLRFSEVRGRTICCGLTPG